MQFINSTCVLCNGVFNTIGGLSRHLYHSHKDIDKTTYYKTVLQCNDLIYECGHPAITIFKLTEKHHNNVIQGSCGLKTCADSIRSKSMIKYYDSDEANVLAHKEVLAAGARWRNEFSTNMTHSNPEVAARQGASLSKIWKDKDSRFNDPEFRKLLSERVCAGQNLECLNKKSLNATRVNTLGLNKPIIKIYTPNRCIPDIRCKSMYEYAWCHYLDSCPEIVDFEYEAITIKYGHQRYTPDFLVTYKDRIEIHEVKPKDFLLEDKVLRKKLVAEEYCSKHNMVYRFITEDDLIEKDVWKYRR